MSLLFNQRCLEKSLHHRQGQEFMRPSFCSGRIKDWASEMVEIEPSSVPIQKLFMFGAFYFLPNIAIEPTDSHG